jgi:hypothetical protein
MWCVRTHACVCVRICAHVQVLLLRAYAGACSTCMGACFAEVCAYASSVLVHMLCLLCAAYVCVHVYNVRITFACVTLYGGDQCVSVHTCVCSFCASHVCVCACIASARICTLNWCVCARLFSGGVCVCVCVHMGLRAHTSACAVLRMCVQVLVLHLRALASAIWCVCARLCGGGVCVCMHLRAHASGCSALRMCV